VSGRGFYFGVAPSWQTNADFFSVRRRADIRTRISFRRGADLESKREFYLDVAPS